MTNLAMDTNTLLSSPQTGVLTVAAVPTAGQGLALDASGQIPAGLVPAATLATSLPVSPSSGQQVILTDSTTVPTYSWLMQFDSTANKWRFIGGSPLEATVATNQGTNSTAYVDLATVGPSITLPIAGTYNVQVETLVDAFDDCYMSFAIGGTAAADANATQGRADATGRLTSCSATTLVTASANNTALVSKYRTFGGGNQVWQRRWIRAWPVNLT